MHREVMRDMSDSTLAFMSHVWPKIGPAIGGGRLIPIESTSRDEVASVLDNEAGIDFIRSIDGKGAQGIGVRIQWGNCWRTHTVRKERSSGAETEYEKRKRAIESFHEFLMPHYMIHAYMQAPRGSTVLLGAAIAESLDIISIIRDKPEGKAKRLPDWWWMQTNPNDGNLLACVPWESLQRLNRWVVIV